MSGVITAVVVTAAAGAYVASESASDATDAAKESAANQLSFAEQQYQDWQETYGGIQDNLAQYYSSITPAAYEAQGLEQFEKERETATKRLDETLAQRGLTGSGVEIAAKSQQDLSAAETRAGIRFDAPRKAAADQMSFLQVGLGQDPSGDVSSVLASQSNFDRQQQNIADRNAGIAAGSFISAAGTALGDYATRNSNAQSGN